MPRAEGMLRCNLRFWDNSCIEIDRVGHTGVAPQFLLLGVILRGFGGGGGFVQHGVAAGAARHRVTRSASAGISELVTTNQLCNNFLLSFWDFGQNFHLLSHFNKNIG